MIKKSPNQIKTQNNSKHSFFRAVYLMGALLCLSIPSFSMQTPEEEREALWSSLRAQKSLQEIYEIRCEENSPLGMEEKNFIDCKCAMEGHPIAQLVIAENIFCKSMSFEASASVEQIINRDCNEAIVSEELKITFLSSTALAKAATSNEHYTAKALVQRAIIGVLDTDEYKSYLPAMCGFGLCGLCPYQPFVDKQSLTTEECKEMFQFWKKKYNDATQLSIEDEVEGKLIFFDKYPTTGRWIECLSKHWQDTEFFFLVHRLLNKLNELPEIELSGESDSSEESSLPWWKDPNWK